MMQKKLYNAHTNLILLVCFFLLFTLSLPQVAAQEIPESIFGAQENNISDYINASLFSLRSKAYSLGSSVAITISQEPDALEVRGPINATTGEALASYQYLGTPRNPLIFIPEFAGTYSITVTSGELIDVQTFEVYSQTFQQVTGFLQANTTGARLQNRSTNVTPVLEPTKVTNAFTIRNARAQDRNPTVTIRDLDNHVLVNKKQEFLEGNAALEQIMERKAENLFATIEPEDDLFTRLELRGVTMDNFSLGIDRPKKTLIGKQTGLEKKNIRILDTFAIDPTGVTFLDGNLTKTATGTELYKCAEWIFVDSYCAGTWKKYMDIIPGEEYVIPIDPKDPAFFETGVATVNAKKPIYEPSEQATLLMAVLDTKGFLVSGANVTLQILSPTNSTTTYSTSDDTVIEISQGIYEAKHTATAQGIYGLFVTAQGPGVDVVMHSNYTVAQNYPYDIYRDSPMSIDPWNGAYRTTLLVEAHTESVQPFTLRETIPRVFNITDAGGAQVRHSGNNTILSWPYTGLGTSRTYFAQTPLVSPDLYPLGRASVEYTNSSGLQTFAEARTWWLAIDPTEQLDPIVNVNTEVGGVDLSAAQVGFISTDNTQYVTFGKNVILTVELSNPTNTTPIESVSSLSCSVTYTSQAYSPNVIYRVYDAFGGTILNQTTLPPSTGGDNTVTIANINGGSFVTSDLSTLALYFSNVDGGKSDSISIDDVWCTVSYTETDIESPTISLQNPINNFNTTQTTLAFNYTPADNVDFANCSLYIDGTLNASNASAITNGSVNSISSTFNDGAYNWSVGCFDGGGNSGFASQTRDFLVDTTFPTAFSLLSPANDTVSSDLTPTVTWQATTETNFKNYTILFDDDINFGSPIVRQNTSISQLSNTLVTILTANQQYYWKVIAYDIVHQGTESSQTFVYTTDTIDPTAFSLVTPIDDTISTSRTPSLDWGSTVDTNFDNYTIEFDDNADFSSPEHTYFVTSGQANSNYVIGGGEQLLANTIFSWRVIAYDEASRSRISTNTFNYTTDNLGPGVTLLAPSDGSTESFTNTVQFNYSVIDTLSTVASCELIINGTSEQTDNTITESVTQSFDQFLVNGYYEWWVNCTDAVGNENESLHRFLTVDVTVDLTPPAITLNYPENNDYVNLSTITFNYTPQDVTGILNCSIYVDGVFNQTNSSVVTNNQPNYFTVSGFTQGLHPWSVACYDNSTNENFGASSTNNVTVDTVLPTAFSLLSPTNDTQTNDNTQFISWSQTTETNFRNYTIQIDDVTTFSNPEYVYYNTSITQTNRTTSAIADGTWFWRVLAVDLASNWRASSQYFTFTIDTQAPTYTAITQTPLDPAEYNPNTVYNFTINVSDPALDTVFFEHNFLGSAQNYTAQTDNGITYYYSYIAINASTSPRTYRWHMNDTFSNRNQTSSLSYTVNRNTTTTTLLLNGASNNITINESQILNITGLLNWPSSGVVRLRENATLLNQTVSPVVRLKNYTIPGYYRINASYATSQNYAYSEQILYVTVNDIFAPTVTATTPVNDSIDPDGLVTFGFSVADTNTVATCSLYINDTLNETKNSPTKDTVLFYNKVFDVNQDLEWYVSCVDIAGNVGNSTTRYLTIEINEFSESLVPQVCVDANGCTASNMNVSDVTFEGHGGLSNSPGDNDVYANVTVSNIPLGATVTNATIYWDKYQDSADGTFFLYYYNVSSWVQICSQTFTQSSTATTDPLTCTFSNFPTVTQLQNGLHIRGNFFYSGTANNRQYGTNFAQVNITYEEDVTLPSVELTDPTNNFETGTGNMLFNITATDTNLENCTLWGDFNGVWEPNETITVAGALSSGSVSSFPPVFLEVGYFTWNAQCYDIAGNVNFAPQNNTVNITPPDLTLDSNDIAFIPSSPYEGQTIQINATIFNEGFTTAENFIVQFFKGDPDAGGTQINGNQTIVSLAYQENATVSVSYVTTIGPNNIYVRIDGNNSVTETNETNNDANTVLNVVAYSRFFGNTSTEYTLDSSDNSTFLSFPTQVNSTGNLFFSRSGSSINFASLVPLGKTTDDENTSNDFSDADALMNMTGFNDSVNVVWANNTDRPINVSTFVIRGQAVDTVPVVASDADGDFLTGILWDGSDDTGGSLEYDIATGEDIVFIANSEQALIGTYGVQDFEAIIPAQLRQYAGGPVEMIEIYFELV